MRIAIISSCSLPIPAVSGGAVENLVETIVKENEIQNQLNIDVYAIYNSQSELVSKYYPHTTFRYLKKSSLINGLDRIITYSLRIIKHNRSLASRNYLWKMIAISKLKKNLIKNLYDIVVLENTIFLFTLFNNEKLFEKYKGKVFFHIHNSLNKSTTVRHESLLKRCISISDYLHPNIKTFFNNNTDVITVHNGINTSKFGGILSVEENLALRKKYNISKENKIIIFVGRITPEKGINETVAAFCQLEREDCDLVIVGASYFGSGTVSPFENQVIKKIKENHRIHMTGFIAPDEIWKLYALGNVAVLPSMWDEPLGLTMLEAQASGIPLITTKSGGITETVDERYSILLDRNTDIVENIKSAIDTVLNNQIEWDNKAELAKQKVRECFDDSVFYKEFIKALDIN